MADISKIVLPSSQEYSFKDSSAVGSLSYENGQLEETLRDGTTKRLIDLQAPFLTKTYTGILGTASNSAANDSFYFMSVRPDDFYVQWSVRYIIEAAIDGKTNYHTTSDVTFYGIGQAATPLYYIFNKIYSTSYRPFYYHNFYRLSATGFSNGSLRNAIGVGLRGSNDRNTAGYERTITVKVLEAKNCTVTLLDTPLKWADWPNGTTANYAGLTEFDGYTNGLRETGDDNSNTYDRRCMNTAKFVAGGYGIFPYSLIMQDRNGSWQSITITGGNGTAKAVNTTGFLLGSLYYYAYSNNVANGSVTSNNYIYETCAIDARYTFNCGSTLATNSPLYLVGTIENGLFYIDSSMYSQSLPSTNDSKCYVYLGEVYSTTSFDLAATHPIYKYKNGRVENVFIDTFSTLNRTMTDVFSSLDSVPCFGQGVCTFAAAISPTGSASSIFAYTCYGNSSVKILEVCNTAIDGYNYANRYVNGQWQGWERIEDIIVDYSSILVRTSADFFSALTDVPCFGQGVCTFAAAVSPTESASTVFAYTCYGTSSAKVLEACDMSTDGLKYMNKYTNGQWQGWHSLYYWN